MEIETSHGIHTYKRRYTGWAEEKVFWLSSLTEHLFPPELVKIDLFIKPFVVVEFYFFFVL